jgi:hypothetical protein
MSDVPGAAVDQPARRATALRGAALVLTCIALVLTLMALAAPGCSARTACVGAAFWLFLLAEIPALLCLLFAARWPLWLKAAGYVASGLAAAYLSVAYFFASVCA